MSQSIRCSAQKLTRKGMTGLKRYARAGASIWVGVFCSTGLRWQMHGSAPS